MIQNFRDICHYNKKIKPNLVFRSSQYGIENNIEILKKFYINTIIDLRTQSEILNFDYKGTLLKHISYFNIPLNLEFAKLIYHGTPMESAYQYLSLNCQNEIALILKIILNAKGAILIHCRQGIDRTGIVITLLHLICNTTKENIISDYLDSGEFAVQKHLDILLDIVSQQKSIEDYLVYSSLTFEDIQQVRTNLTSL